MKYALFFLFFLCCNVAFAQVKNDSLVQDVKYLKEQMELIKGSINEARKNHVTSYVMMGLSSVLFVAPAVFEIESPESFYTAGAVGMSVGVILQIGTWTKFKWIKE